MDILPKLLSGRNLDILMAISGRDCSMRELAEELGCSPAKLHQAVKLFKHNGLVTTQHRRNRLLLRPVSTHPLYGRLRALYNINRLTHSRSFFSLTKVAAVGVYGSYSQGMDDERSDIDLLVVTTKKEIGLREIIRKLEGELHKPINPLITTREQLAQLAQTDPEFWTRLHLTTIPLSGDVFERAR